MSSIDLIGWTPFVKNNRFHYGYITYYQRQGSLAKENLNEPFVTVNTVTGDLGIKQAQDDYQRLMTTNP